MDYVLIIICYFFNVAFSGSFTKFSGAIVHLVTHLIIPKHVAIKAGPYSKIKKRYVLSVPWQFSPQISFLFHFAQNSTSRQAAYIYCNQDQLSLDIGGQERCRCHLPSHHWHQMRCLPARPQSQVSRYPSRYEYLSRYPWKSRALYWRHNEI